MTRNPVFKYMRGKNGPHKTQEEKEAKSYKSKKLKKEIEEADERWIQDELKELDGTR